MELYGGGMAVFHDCGVVLQCNVMCHVLALRANCRVACQKCCGDEQWCVGLG